MSHIDAEAITLKVYLEDTDAQGYVYHANYLKYFERSRSNFINSINISHNDLKDHDLAFVAKKIEIDFLSPAYLEDELIIRSKVYLKSKARLSFIQTAEIKSNGLVCCSANAEICLINIASKKPKPLPNDLLLFFGKNYG